MSLYLQYRPKTFDAIVGQDHIIDILQAQAQQGKFSHNYLLYGPRGTGKTSTARLLAKMANATTDDLATDPIAELIDKGQTLDYVEIDAASHTGVDNIREEIIDKALYPPTHLQKKVYVIDEVHMLSKGAFNALLKIMEEPPKYLMFVLATTEINKVPDTIISRCQVFNFKRIGIDAMTQRLAHIADKEAIDYEPEGLRLLAKISSGALRDAIKYLEQVAMLGKVTAAHVSQFLGVVSDQAIASFVALLVDHQEEALYAQIDDLYANGTDLGHFAKDLLLWLDEHFMELPETYSQLAEICRNIFADVKRYPYPVLVYKSSFYHRFHPKGTVVPSPTIDTKKPTPSTEGSSSSKEVSTKNQTPSSSAPTEKSDDTVDTDHTQLMQDIIAKVDKKMVKSILKNNAIIDSLEGDVITIIVINEQYYNSLQKSETASYLADIISQVRDEPTKIKRVYMTKEAYLQKAMG